MGEVSLVPRAASSPFMKTSPVESVADAVPLPVVPPVRRSKLRAILTDLHFWVPVVVLCLGLVMLAFLN